MDEGYVNMNMCLFLTRTNNEYPCYPIKKYLYALKFTYSKKHILSLSTPFEGASFCQFLHRTQMEPREKSFLLAIILVV